MGASDPIFDLDRLHSVVDDFLQFDEFAFDVETMGQWRLDPRRNIPFWIVLAGPGGRTEVIPFGHPHGEQTGITREPRVDSSGKTKYFRVPVFAPAPRQLAIEDVLSALKRLFFSDVRKVGHSVKFDAETLAKYWGALPPGPWGDTQILAHLKNENDRVYKLGSVLERELGVKYDKSIGAEVEKYSLSTAAEYTHNDGRYTWLLWTRLSRLVEEDGLAGVRDLAFDVLPALMAMETSGIPLDVEAATALDRDLDKQLVAVRRKLYEIVGHEWNFDSNPQKQQIFYAPKSKGGRGLKPMKKTKGGAPSCDEEALRHHEGDPLVDAFLRYQELSKISGTYVKSYLGTAERKTRDKNRNNAPALGDDGRVHCNFKQHGTATGRLSASEPNLQNCYSADTEILTQDGWVAFPDLRDDDQVAQWWEDGRIDFVVPDRVIRQCYNGPMIRISSEYMDLLVTPDHRMVSKGRRSGAAIIDTAEEWFSRWAGRGVIVDRKLVRGGVRQGGIRLTDVERRSLFIAVMVQADGYQRPARDTKYDVACRSARKQKQMIELVGAERVRSRPNGDRMVVTISYHEVSRWLDDTKEKNFKPEAILALCREDLEAFLAEVMRWDGDFTRGITYHQQTERLLSVDVVQAAAVLTGRSTSWNQRDFGATVNVHRSAERYASRVTVTKELYDGHVYCVTVPSGAVVVRRDDDVVVCGNCPRPDTDLGKQIRSLFIAPPGHKLIVADYKQIEYVVMAHFSGDPTLIRFFEEGRDFHLAVAAMILGKPEDQVTKVERTVSKNVNFAVAYGAGISKIARMSGISEDQARKFSNAHRGMLPALYRFTNDVIKVCRSRKPPHVKTLLGRKRRLPTIFARDDGVRSYAERQAINSVVQGSAADINLVGLVRLHDVRQRHPWFETMLNVHDEFVVSVPEDRVDEGVELVREAMVGPGVQEMLKVRLDADIHVVDRWSEAK